MQTRKSCDFQGHAFIWPAEDSSSNEKGAEYSERRIGFFQAQLRAARQRRAEKLRRRQEAKQLREEQRQIEALQKGYEPCRVVDREHAPEYLQRQFVYKYYLVGGTPAEAAWFTLFNRTNETFNAWSMLPPFILAWAGVYLARTHLPTEASVFWILLLSAVPHAPFSVGLHLTCGTSRAWRDLWRGLDVFFILTCGVPRAAALAWYVFYEWQQYAMFMSVAVLIYSRSVYRNIIHGRVKDITKPALARAIMGTIACYAFPLLIAAIREYDRDDWGIICSLVALIGVTFVASMVTYGCKYPERLAPGRFDFIGNGHQLIHVSVTIEYGLELFFLWHMAAQKTAAKQSMEADDQTVRSLLGGLL